MIHQPLSLELQLKVIDRVIELQQESIEYYRGVRFYNGICYNTVRAIKEICGLQVVWYDIDIYIPKLIRANAYKFGADRYNSFWWPRHDTQSRLTFLYYVKGEIEKEIKPNII